MPSPELPATLKRGGSNMLNPAITVSTPSLTGKIGGLTVVSSPVNTTNGIEIKGTPRSTTCSSAGIPGVHGLHQGGGGGTGGAGSGCSAAGPISSGSRGALESAVAATAAAAAAAAGGGASSLSGGRSVYNSGDAVSSSELMSRCVLGRLLTKVSTSVREREQEMRRMAAEQKEYDDLLARSQDELKQLIDVFWRLQELQQSAREVLPGVIMETQQCPERPRITSKPPFTWQPSQEYADEFEVSGECGEIVKKTRDFEDQGWVIPVGGSWRLMSGGLYRWTLRIERKCPSRPQLQIGIHGANHSQPWRLITTSRCSWSRDDEPWQDRPGGDRLIDEGDYVHIEVDLRGTNLSKLGSLSIAINDEAFEQFFTDIPLNTPYPLIPVVSMGGDNSRVRLCRSY